MKFNNDPFAVSVYTDNIGRIKCCSNGKVPNFAEQ